MATKDQGICLRRLTCVLLRQCRLSSLPGGFRVLDRLKLGLFFGDNMDILIHTIKRPLRLSSRDTVEPFTQKNSKLQPTKRMLNAPYKSTTARNKLHAQLDRYTQGMGRMQHRWKEMRPAR